MALLPLEQLALQFIHLLAYPIPSSLRLLVAFRLPKQP